MAYAHKGCIYLIKNTVNVYYCKKKQNVLCLYGHFLSIDCTPIYLNINVLKKVSYWPQTFEQ